MQFPAWSWEVLWEALVAALALVGAVLGVLNGWGRLRDRGVRLRVTTTHLFRLEEEWQPPRVHGVAVQRLRVGVEVVNLSSFPVTISSAGIMYKGLALDAAYPDLDMLAQRGPQRIGSRESITLYFPPDVTSEHDLTKAKRLYAKTACGAVRYDSAKEARQLPALQASERQKGGGSCAPDPQE